MFQLWWNNMFICSLSLIQVFVHTPNKKRVFCSFWMSITERSTTRDVTDYDKLHTRDFLCGLAYIFPLYVNIYNTVNTKTHSFEYMVWMLCWLESSTSTSCCAGTICSLKNAESLQFSHLYNEEWWRRCYRRSLPTNRFIHCTLSSKWKYQKSRDIPWPEI